MIKKDSKEWENFVSQIEYIKTKSNRQVLCAKCWLMLNYEQKIKHLKENPEHENSILTSAKFATSQQMISLAQACNKLIYKNDGQYIISPFIGVTRHILDSQESPDTMPNNSSSSNPLQGSSSRSNDSQNGNSENDDNQIKTLSNRLNMIESTVDGIQKTLNVFAQCLQNTHILQQKILDQMRLSNPQQQVQSPSPSNNDQSFQNFLSQNQGKLSNNLPQPSTQNNSISNQANQSFISQNSENDKNKQVNLPLSLSDMGQDMIRRTLSLQQIAGTSSQYIYKQTTKQHYESTDSMKSEPQFNPFMQAILPTFQPVLEVQKESLSESVIQQMSGEQFFQRLNQTMQNIIGKRNSRSFDKASSYDEQEKEELQSEGSRKQKI